MAELLRDGVYRALRHAILTCELMPGQDLREQVLAQKYRVSRSPIRDSLLRLEHEKLVTVLPRQGYRVNPISLRDVEELFGLRLIIAPACAADAARADDTAVRTLDRFRTVVNDDSDEAALLDYNRAFHGAVADLAGNTRIAAVELSLVEEFDRLILASMQASQNMWLRHVLDEHGAVIDAIQAHDSDTAYHLTRAHVAEGQLRVREALRTNNAQQDSSVVVEVKKPAADS